MQSPLQITFRDLPHSAALETLIHEKAAKLDAHHPRITDLRLPRREIAVTCTHDEDVHVALREAFETAVRRLEHARGS